MTALSANRVDLKRKEGEIEDYKVEASGIIYAGALCTLDGGYLEAGVDTASHIFAGVAREYVTNASGSDGDVNAQVYRTGSYEFSIASVAQTDVGALAYVRDDQTVDQTSTNGIIAGTIVEYISSTKCRVDIGDRVA